MVAGFFDELGGFLDVRTRVTKPVLVDVEPSLGEMVVGEEEAHAGAAGDLEDFVEIVLSAACKEGKRQEVETARSSQVINALPQVEGGFRRACGVSAPKRDVVEAHIR